MHDPHDTQSQTWDQLPNSQFQSDSAATACLERWLPGFEVSGRGELSCRGVVVPCKRRFGDELLITTGESPPFVLDSDQFRGARFPLYDAYRDIAPAREMDAMSSGTDEITYTRCDLVLYHGQDLYRWREFGRSIGHWNPRDQLEAFQVLLGDVVIIVCGMSRANTQYSFVRRCREGDWCVIPSGAWHITYALAAPSIVLNAYTSRQHPATGTSMHSYHTKPVVEMGMCTHDKEISVFATRQSLQKWGHPATTAFDRDVLSYAERESLADLCIVEPSSHVTAFWRGVQAAESIGWPHPTKSDLKFSVLRKGLYVARLG